MAICGSASSVLSSDDTARAGRDISDLARLDHHHDTKHIRLYGTICVGLILSYFCQGAGPTQTSCEVHVR